MTYSLLAWSAVTIARHQQAAGSTESEDAKVERLTRELMEKTGGRWLVGAIGVVLVAVGLYFVIKGIRAKFRDELEPGGVGPFSHEAIVTLGRVGWIGRGLVMGLVGWFVTSAAVKFQAGRGQGHRRCAARRHRFDARCPVRRLRRRRPRPVRAVLRGLGTPPAPHQRRLTAGRHAGHDRRPRRRRARRGCDLGAVAFAGHARPGRPGGRGALAGPPGRAAPASGGPRQEDRPGRGRRADARRRPRDRVRHGLGRRHRVRHGRPGQRSGPLGPGRGRLGQSTTPRRGRRTCSTRSPISAGPRSWSSS